MAFQFRTHAVAFLAACLMLMLAAGLYQRVANPSLEYHLDHAPAASEADHDHPPLSPEETEKLNRAMADLGTAPNDIGKLLAIADIFRRNKDWINAAAFLARAAEAAPADMRPRYYQGVTLAQKGEFANAAMAFEHALRLAPENAPAQFNLAVLYRYHLDKPEKARSLFNAIASSPSSDASLRQKAKEELGK